MAIRSLISAGAALLALSFVAHPARADERDPAAAQALFDQGVELVSAGKFAEACPKLAESQRLDPGIGTQFHLANCYEQVGRVASAWALFLEVASVARASNQSDRENVASARARKLESRLPRLTLSVTDARRLPGLEIRRDGSAVGSAQWGTPMPIDPGSHELTVSAPGRKTATQTVTLREGEKQTFEVPELAAAPVEPATATATAEPAAPSEPPPEQAGSRPTALILGLGGLGLVGVGVGTAFGLMARSDYKDSKQHCRVDDPNLCQPEGMALRESAIKNGNISTVAFVVGGVALAGAGVLWLVTGSSGEDSASSTGSSSPKGPAFRAGASLGWRSFGINAEGRF